MPETPALSHGTAHLPFAPMQDGQKHRGHLRMVGASCIWQPIQGAAVGGSWPARS
jgi:hypothetical protein